MGWVADNQPRVFLTYEDGRLYDYADGPSLGVLNFWDAVEFDAAGNGSVDAAVLTQETERFLTEAQLSEYGFEVGGEFLSEELLYNVTSDTELGLLWRMSLRADCGMTFLIDIDGVTGETRGINGIVRRQSDSNARGRFDSNDPLMRCRFPGAF